MSGRRTFNERLRRAMPSGRASHVKVLAKRLGASEDAVRSGIDRLRRQGCKIERVGLGRFRRVGSADG